MLASWTIKKPTNIENSTLVGKSGELIILWTNNHVCGAICRHHILLQWAGCKHSECGRNVVEEDWYESIQ